MKNKAGKIAVVDIGSNSVRLFVFSFENNAPRQLYARKFFCGLGRDLGVTGRLNPEASEMALGHLEFFRQELKKHEVVDELVIGTAALREAQDAAEFVAAAKSRSGFDIKIIDGDEEARLAALAILCTNPNAEGIVADFGGGSLEIARISGGQIQDKISLRLGAHYIKALPDRAQGIAEGLAVLGRTHGLKDAPALYIIGGSWRSLAKAWMVSRARHDELENMKILPSEIVPFCREIQGKEPDELIGRYHMEVPRAQLMDVSAQMLEALITEINPAIVTVSTAGIRDGLAFDYFQKGTTA